ncbi:DivIVA domain-containing protein [Companilactobacillus sp.]|jgi:cell division initiation protein|uniref:DivIVA domain-containing protein n=1 Tax=Companilactobacillus sp. TaxID=2767905 RepID=UPI0025B9B02E|nr:DivIVA domain-containing protein [Companilactobacillus sp.]MCH4008439.1 DivIVA domain-containing protein [Companilactobacillus sp.]MCH4051382.1 DivIVA domain-containing protein [Companilactobacillus sp.]MCH4076382.1 DivIVA domain-containing protein [Companilactobacillus sp.]MCH4124957.1 DivIVA domain-containing protein [Companilactobacillus sp.]MCH4131499.1 DivIVA domain-containing protein [Companilactobacillus sp.]
MVLSPIEIHNKEFDRKFRGYDREEVDKFLDQIVNDYDLALQQNAQLQKDLKQTQSQLKYFTEMKDALNQSILVAQDAADKVKANAEKEAQVISEEAQSKARELLDQSTDKSNQILEDASDKARQVTIQTDDLKGKTSAFRATLQKMLQQQLDYVESPEWNKMLEQTSTEDLKQRIGAHPDDQNMIDQNPQGPMDDFQNSQEGVSKQNQEDYNENIPDNKTSDSYTINNDQNGPTFNFDSDQEKE